MGRLIIRYLKPFFFFALSLIFISLSFWQYKRLQFKESLILSLHQNIESYVDGKVENSKNLFKKIKLKGSFIGKGYYLYSSYQKESGYELIDVFQSNSGEYYLVNMGFVSELKNLPRSIEKPVSFEGYITNQNTAKTPLIDNDYKNNTLFYIDFKEIKKRLGVDNLLPVVILPNSNKLFLGKKILINEKVNIINNHFQYAVTWFCLFLVSLVIAVILYRKVERELR